MRREEDTKLEITGLRNSLELTYYDSWWLILERQPFSLKLMADQVNGVLELERKLTKPHGRKREYIYSDASWENRSKDHTWYCVEIPPDLTAQLPHYSFLHFSGAETERINYFCPLIIALGKRKYLEFVGFCISLMGDKCTFIT